MGSAPEGRLLEVLFRSHQEPRWSLAGGGLFTNSGLEGFLWVWRAHWKVPGRSLYSVKVEYSVDSEYPSESSSESILLQRVGYNLAADLIWPTGRSLVSPALNKERNMKNGREKKDRGIEI